MAPNDLHRLEVHQRPAMLLDRITSFAAQTADVGAVAAFMLREICRCYGLPIGHAILFDLFKVQSDPIEIWHVAHDAPADLKTSLGREVVFRAGSSQPSDRADADRLLQVAGLDGELVPLPPVAAATSDAGAAWRFPILVGNDIACVLEFFSQTSPVIGDELTRTMVPVSVQLQAVIERQCDRLPYEVTHDRLTSLPNLVLLQSIANRIVNKQGVCALVLIDLDNFRLINDGLGRAAGDALLLEVSHRFVDAAMGGALVARVGGDKFAILLSSDDAGFDPRPQADRLHAALKTGLELHGRKRSLSCSVGIAISMPGPATGGDGGEQFYTGTAELLRDAELAMHQAKKDGRCRTVVFNAAMHAAAVERLNLEADLQTALARNEFVLHLQPIVRLADNRIKGFEALVRWLRPGHGLVMPSGFISVLEDTGLVIPFGHWLIREACTILRTLRDRRPEADWPFLSINLSVRQFDDPELFETVSNAVEKAGLPPSSLRFEVTESLTIQDLKHGASVLRSLADLGFGISLDDFGTGYSSLGYLRSLPVDSLKIDRSFVEGIEEEGGSLRIVRAVLGLAASIGLTVVAEGVETEDQVALLAQLGCTYGQGYHFARPLPVHEATLLLDRGHDHHLQAGALVITDCPDPSTIQRGIRRKWPILQRQLHGFAALIGAPRETGRSELPAVGPRRSLALESRNPEEHSTLEVPSVPGFAAAKRRFSPFLAVAAFMVLHAGLIVALPAYRAILSPLCLAVGPGVAAAACWRIAAQKAASLRPNWMLAALAFLFWAIGSLTQVWAPMGASAGMVDFVYFLFSLALLFAITAPENNQAKRLSLLMDGLQALLGAFLGFIVIFGAVPFSSEKISPMTELGILWTYDAENAVMVLLAGLRLLAGDRSSVGRCFNRSMLLFTLVYGSLGSLYNHVSPPNSSPLDIMLDPAFFLMAIMAGRAEDKGLAGPRVRTSFTAFIESIGPVFLTAAVLVVGSWIARQRLVPGIVSILAAVAIYALRVSLLQARYLITHQELRETRDQMERLALEDGLTGVGNRRAYDAALGVMWAEAKHSGEPLSALMIDVDFFKAYNDRFGHPTGDVCLIQIASVLRTVTQHYQGLVARYGGEEFAILLPHMHSSAAREVASTIRHAVAALDLKSRTGTAAPVTVSIGVATTRWPGSLEALLLAADDALYRAKRNGRDRIETEALDVVPV